MKKRLFILGLLSLIVVVSQTLTAQAHSYKKGAILIGHAWGLPSQGPSTQVFFPLTNNGTKADKLLSLSTPAARQTVFIDASGQSVSHFDLGVKTPLPMRPGARHIQLNGLVKPLRHGERIPLTLRFEQAGVINVEVWIEPRPYAKKP
jgi:periplasmic copper chaperone A